jgi:hypothetical protein
LARIVAIAIGAAKTVEIMQLSPITLAIKTKMEYLSMLTISSMASANTALVEYSRWWCYITMST